MLDLVVSIVFTPAPWLIPVSGGTAAAAGRLVELSEAQIMGYLFMIDIINLKGTSLLGDKPIITLVKHNEEE